jgi:hypothetical protein
MHKKLITACVALAAFAAFVVLPATASAVNKPVITHPTRTVLKTGVCPQHLHRRRLHRNFDQKLE